LFDVGDIILIALMAGLGIATKQVIAPLVSIVTAPLYIPGGTLAGGIYMMWPIIARGVVNKKGAGFLCTLIQSIVVFSSPFGVHGAATFPIYLAPGIAIELVFLVASKYSLNIFPLAVSGMLANLVGSLMVAVIIMGVREYVLILICVVASLSGIFGGLMAFGMIRAVHRVLPADSRYQDQTHGIKSK